MLTNVEQHICGKFAHKCMNLGCYIEKYAGKYWEKIIDQFPDKYVYKNPDKYLDE